MSQRTVQVGVAVGVSLAVLAIFFLLNNPFATDSGLNAAQPAGALSATQPGQLIAQDELKGTGTTAQAGDLVTVNYTGKLQNGTVFDTSVGKGPFTFTLGAGEVIKGWDLGVSGMKVGGKRLLIIPPEMAYGIGGYGPVPPNSTLVFEVELLKVVAGAATVTQ